MCFCALSLNATHVFLSNAMTCHASCVQILFLHCKCLMLTVTLHVNCIFQMVREAPREAVNVDNAAQLFSQL